MTKKTANVPNEPIKLTVEPVEEKPILASEEPIVSGSIPAVDDLYSEKSADNNGAVSPAEESSDISPDVSPAPVTAVKSPQKGFLLFVGGLLFGGMITGGIFNFIINPKNAENRPKVSGAVSVPTPVVEVTPEITQAVEEVDYSKYSVKILNGSGVTGAAAEVKALIGELKFKSVQTGNASVSNQKETTVQLKAGVPAAVFEKVSQLLVKYTVVEGDALEDSAGVDIQIIVGTQK